MASHEPTQANGGVSVRSRSSSIVSTRTGVTIATLQDDARSVRSMELVVGRRIFSINRDGSRITEHPGLPPYSFAPPEYSSLDSVAGNTPSYQEVVSSPDETAFNAIPPSGFPNVPPEQSRSELSATPVPEEHCSVVRTHSFIPGPEKISVISKRRSVSESNIQANLFPNYPHQYNFNQLQRRNGVRLAPIDTGYATRNPAGASSNHRGSHSAGASMGGGVTQDLQAGSRYASGVYRYDDHHNDDASRGRSPPTTPRATRSPALAIPQGPPTVEEGYADTEVPPTMDTENEISIHFSRLVRSIDREHRKVLHQKCRELADLRERLNEVDQVYRKELRARDFTIDELRTQINLMEAKMEERVERARNEVEDTWEKRWKEQEEVLLNMQRKKSQLDLSRMVGRRRIVGGLLPLSPSAAAIVNKDEEKTDGNHT